MNRSNRNMKMENKKREQTKQDIPKGTEHEIKDEDYHLSQRRDDTDRGSTLTPSHAVEPVYARKINFLKAVNSVVYLERMKNEELETDKSYLIEQVERITTKYGDAIIAILRGPWAWPAEAHRLQDDDVQSAPSKEVLTRLSDDHLEYMNEGVIYLDFIGGKYNDLEFH